MKGEKENSSAHDELQRRKLQEYLFGLEEMQEKAEELAAEHESLKHSRELLIAILSGTVHGICMVVEDRFEWCNPAMIDVFGWSQDELVGKTIRHLYPTRSKHEEMAAFIRERLSQAGQITFESSFVNKNGNLVPCLVTGGALDRWDLSKGYVLSFTDVTERRNAEEALRKAHEGLEQKVLERTNELSEANTRLVLEVEARKRTEEALQASEEKFRSVFSESKDCIYLIDPKTKHLIEANPAFLALFGYRYQEIRDLTVYDLADASPEEVDSGLSLVLSTQSCYIGERNFRTKSGRIVEVEVNANTLVLGGEKLICVVCRDMMERKKMREAILRADKLSSVGLLAGGIAHDFNNLLTTIMGNISLSRLHAKPTGKAAKLLEEAEKACLRAKGLTLQLLTFSKGGAPIKETTSVIQTIEESVSFVLSGSNVGCRYELPDDAWPVDIDTGQISQVIGNIIVNAKQAMPEGGMIDIAVQNQVLNETSGLPLQPGRYVKVSIKDEGPGILEAHLGNIFDPYFTTKQKGSGLGLTTCYSIVKQHEGHIDVESQQGSGTTFSIYLPASTKKIQTLDTIESTPTGGKGKVLVVDDEETLREIVSEMLGYLGYEVDLASDGRQAIKLYEEAEQNGCAFDVIIMDLTIPGGMGGKVAIKKLMEKHPEVKVIVSSGYCNDPILSDFAQHGFKGVVTKPYTVKELDDVLQRVLSAPNQDFS